MDYIKEPEKRMRLLLCFADILKFRLLSALFLSLPVSGTAAYLCLTGNKALSALDGKRVRECLKQGGSAL